jgi:hypothetical protein
VDGVHAVVDRVLLICFFWGGNVVSAGGDETAENDFQEKDADCLVVDKEVEFDEFDAFGNADDGDAVDDEKHDEGDGQNGVDQNDAGHGGERHLHEDEEDPHYAQVAGHEMLVEFMEFPFGEFFRLLLLFLAQDYWKSCCYRVFVHLFICFKVNNFFLISK